jgi:integrase
MPSHSRNESYARRHLLSSVLAALPVPRVTASDIETFLQSKVGALSPKSTNNLRGYIQTIFNCAKRAGQFNGANPVNDVRKRKVAKRKPHFLEAHEAMQVLDALAPRWRPLFAAALFTGLRKGELAGLRKSDIRLPARQMMISRSYDRDTTKGGHEDALPIADQFVPFLEHALSDNSSDYVFPGPDRQMFADQTGPSRRFCGVRWPGQGSSRTTSMCADAASTKVVRTWRSTTMPSCAGAVPAG